jgi:hypothetical protein
MTNMFILIAGGVFMGKTVIQLESDTAANWTTNNPTLAQGEMGIETDKTGSSLATALPHGTPFLMSAQAHPLNMGFIRYHHLRQAIYL